MLRQYQLTVLIFLSIICSFISGCSFFEDTPDSKAKLPKRFATDHVDTLTVEIQELKPEKVASDVLVTLQVSDIPIDKVHLKYGSSPQNLTNQKIYNASELNFQETEEGTKTTSLRIKDVGEIIPLFISTAIEAQGIMSDYSSPTLVPE